MNRYTFFFRNGELTKASSGFVSVDPAKLDAVNHMLHHLGANYIYAIKTVRALSNVSLSEAKQIVDLARIVEAARMMTKTMHSVPSSGYTGSITIERRDSEDIPQPQPKLDERWALNT